MCSSFDLLTTLFGCNLQLIPTVDDVQLCLRLRTPRMAIIGHSVLADTTVDLIIGPNILFIMWEEGMNTTPQIYCNNNKKKQKNMQVHHRQANEKKAS